MGRAAIERALELNGIAVEANRLAFGCGRLAAAEPAALGILLGVANKAVEPVEAVALDTIIERASKRLADYQNSGYALRYQNFIARVRAAERSVLPAGTPLELTRQVAVNYARLLACKDEYEVARLYANGSLELALDEQFTGNYAVHYHFAPGFLVKTHPDGRPAAKRSFGPVLRRGLKLLAGLRGLRGTLLDPFGWSQARRSERALAAEYVTLICQLLPGLNEANVGKAAQIAALPDSVRGFGHVRQVATTHMREQASDLLQSLSLGSPVSD